MKRRSFIAKTLAGLAAIPLLGKLVQAQPQIHDELVRSYNPTVYLRAEDYHRDKGIWYDSSGNGNHFYEPPEYYFDRELSAEEIAEINAYMMKKYGL